MRVKKRLRIRWLSLFFLLVFPVAAYGGMPEVSHVMVTDVTTTSFSVIWMASEASTADLEVYADENGDSLIADAIITAHPIESGDDTIKEAAEDNGVMKVRVTDLEPDTTYYFMTITTSKPPDSITTYYPDAEPFMSVTTESETVRTYESGGNIFPFCNDVITESCYLNDGTHAVGTLLLATLEGGNYPITAFVGDGVDPPYAMIDLNNVFSRETHENLDLFQGKNLTLLNFRGRLGNSIVTHDVPEDLSLCEVKQGAPGLKEVWNFVSYQLEPDDTDLETILAPIIDKVSAVWTYDTEEDKWYKYLKDDEYGVTNLYDIHSLFGYWIVIEDGEEASLKLNGNFVTNETIPLYSGWNMIGYRSPEVMDLMDAIQPISSQVDAIWTYNTESDSWQKYLREDEYGVTDLFYLIPGKAYWIVVNSDCNWIAH